MDHTDDICRARGVVHVIRLEIDEDKRKHFPSSPIHAFTIHRQNGIIAVPFASFPRHAERF